MRKSALLTLLGVIALVAIVVAVAAPRDPVKVIESRLVRTGNNVYVEGRVRNTGQAAAGPTDLNVRYYALNGDAIGEDVLKVKRLRAGSEAAFHTPSRSLAAVRSYSIYLSPLPRGIDSVKDTQQGSSRSLIR